jgi:hypothetical protein
MQPARARAAPAKATETTASYTFNVVAITEAGLTEDALQFALLKELVGVKLPGIGRLLVIALGEATCSTRAEFYCLSSST